MCYENLTRYAVVRYCIIGTHCCFDNIYKLGYIIVSRLNIIRIYRPTHEPPTESVVKVADTVKAVGDGGILQGEIDMVPIGDFDHR